MSIQIEDIYNYVFGGRAKTKIDDKLPKDLREGKIKKDAENTKAIFKSITDNDTLSPEFRKTLRELKSSDLEIVLYGNNTEEMKATSDNPFPSPDDITKKFKTLNEEYGYFKIEKKEEEAYSRLFKACKIIADYTECKTEHKNANNNEVAYIHAYKLFVLFGDNLNKVDRFINQLAKKNYPNPIHDILVLNIPKNDPPINNLNAWRNLLVPPLSAGPKAKVSGPEAKASGPEALKYFQQAPGIEAALNRAPRDLGEAAVMLSAMTLKRVKENPELAKLCIKYDVSEDTFNKCLAIKPKQKDNLPTIAIDGATINYPGYHLVKLPVDDPHAYLLGETVNNCQSIGGNSEQCVIDGITLEDNGFYVLLQATNRDKSKPPMVNGKIDYKNYAIVGEGYAWLSKMGNLTFDSWENLTPKVTDQIIAKLLPEFAKKVTTEEKSEIVRVTIGTSGGKTPEEFKNTPIRDPEKMNMGFEYSDAKTQSSLYINSERVKPLIQECAAEISKLFHRPIDPKEVDSLFQITSTRFKLPELFSPETKDFWRAVVKDDTSLSRLVDGAEKGGGAFWEVLSLLRQSNYLDEKNYDQVLSQAPYTPIIMLAFSAFKEAHILTAENCKGMLSYAGDVETWEIAQLFVDLNKAHSLTADICKDILNNVPNAPNTAAALVILNKGNISNDVNRKDILSNPAEAVGIANAFVTLSFENILNDCYRKDILSNPAQAGHIADAFRTLNKANILNDDNRMGVLSNPAQAVHIAGAFVKLNEAHILNDENRNSLISIVAKLSNGVNVFNLAKIFVKLHEAKASTEYNRIRVLSRANDAEEIFDALRNSTTSDCQEILNKYIQVSKDLNAGVSVETNRSSLFTQNTNQVTAVQPDKKDGDHLAEEIKSESDPAPTSLTPR